MTMGDRFDTRAMLTGAALAGGVALVLGIAGNAFRPGAPLFAVLILAGMVVGGFVAAKAQPASALSSGGLAAMLGSGAVMIISLLLAVARSTFDLNDVVFAAFMVMLSTSLGTLGGYVAFRRDLKSRSRVDTAT